MSCRFRADVHAVIAQRRTILLDARANSYFSLAPEVDAAFQRLLEKPAGGDDLATLAPLVTTGLIVGNPAQSAFVLPARPLAPAREMDRESSSVGAGIASAARQIRCARMLRRRSLVEINASLAALYREAERAPTDTVQRRLTGIAGGFHRNTLLLQPLDRCLVRSLAFAMQALRQRIPVRLTIGVTANPFAAHCWVQFDDMVVNDTLERVRSFAPIAVLG